MNDQDYTVPRMLEEAHARIEELEARIKELEATQSCGHHCCECSECPL